MGTTEVLVQVQGVLAGASLLGLVAVALVILVYRKYRDVNERFICWLAIVNICFALTLLVPALMTGMQPIGSNLFCQQLAAITASHNALVLLEVLFTGSIAYALRENRFLPRHFEHLCIALALLTGVVTEAVTAVRCPHPASALRIDSAFAVLESVLLGIDFFLGCALLVVIRNRQTKFATAIRELEAFIVDKAKVETSDGSEAVAGRQLQVTLRARRDFGQYVFPVRLYVFLFVAFSIPQIVYYSAPGRRKSEFLDVALLLLAPRGIAFACIYFSDPDSRSEAHPRRLVPRLRKALFGSRIRFQPGQDVVGVAYAALDACSDDEEGEGQEAGPSLGNRAGRRATSAAAFASVPYQEWDDDDAADGDGDGDGEAVLGRVQDGDSDGRDRLLHRSTLAAT